MRLFERQRMKEKMGMGMRTSRWLAAGLLVSGLALPSVALANHPVLVEGEADFDGDGRIGQAEDQDGPAGDAAGLTFGTIAGCLGALNAAINQNGICQIVTSGNFAEVVNITNQVTIEAAPGVLANIEAFLAGPDPRRQQFPTAAGDANALQRAPGIVINSPANRYVILRNLSVTNWTDGVRVMGNSHVLIDDVEIDHNINNGIVISDNAEVLITNSQITSTGFRLNPVTGDFPGVMAPMAGAALNLQGTSKTAIANSTISGNFGPAVTRSRDADLDDEDVITFDNNRRNELPAPMMPPPPPPPPAPPAM
jgi:Right handed beta helix region